MQGIDKFSYLKEVEYLEIQNFQNISDLPNIKAYVHEY
jgi:hypothetical protein